MPIAKINDIEMYYTIQGQGDPLVLISGFGGDNNNWEFMIDNLTKTFQVVIPDNRGAGQTTQPQSPYTITQMAQDIIALLDHLALDKVAIAGTSMGGAIVQQLCLDFPERISAAIIAGSAPKMPKAALMSIECSLDFIRAGVDKELVIRAILPTVYGSTFLEDPDNIQFIMDRILNNPHPQTLEGSTGQLQALTTFNVKDRLEQITCPTLILIGEEDILIPKKYSDILASRINKVTLQVIPQCGHILALEAPVAFSNAIKQFLSTTGNNK